MSVREMSLKMIMSSCLRSIFSRARFTFSRPYSAAKPPGTGHRDDPPHRRGCRGSAFQADCPLVPALAYLASGRSVGNPVVGHRRRHDKDVAVGQALHDLGMHLAGGRSFGLADSRCAGISTFGLDQLHCAPRSKAARARANPILPELRLPMKRTASIGSRCPGGDEHAQAAHGRALRCTWSRSFTSATMLSGSPCDPNRNPAGQLARAGLNHEHPSFAEQAHVVLSGRVLPHVGVHGRAITTVLLKAKIMELRQVSAMPLAILGPRVVWPWRGRDHNVGVLASSTE